MKSILKSIFIFSILFSLILLAPSDSFAQVDFYVDTTVNYKMFEDSKTTVTHTITLENVNPRIYATSYSITLENIDPENIVAYDKTGTLNASESKNGDFTFLKVDFNDSLIGKGSKRTFNIEFEVSDFAKKTGEVWEISIPRLKNDESFRTYDVNVYVPDTFGNKAYISPEPKAEEKYETGTKYSFVKEHIINSSIQAGFGEFQVFSFTINYHIENPLNQRAETSIPLPPDTSYQKVYYEVVDPKPKKIVLDADKNWIAYYELRSKERIDIKVQGTVKIYSDAQTFLEPSQEYLVANLAPDEFWEVSNPKIKDVSANIKSPRDVYDYVVETLDYDYERVRPNVSRMGALSALNYPEQAICMEFTDLFVAVARAAGIPAREINGYAYTENPDIQPLSLVADVLHAWPEYWDAKLKAWVPVDPTWADTTGGIDYFEKLDLRHFTFVIHGTSSTKPYAPGSYKLGSNPQKDIFVSFGKLTNMSDDGIELSAQVAKKFPYISSDITVTIENNGPQAYYNIIPKAFFPDVEKELPVIEFIPPFSSTDIEVGIPFSFLGIKTPEVVSVEIIDSRVDVPSYKSVIILNSLLMLFIIIFTLLFVIFIGIKRRKILSYFSVLYYEKLKIFQKNKGI